MRSNSNKLLYIKREPGVLDSKFTQKLRRIVCEVVERKSVIFVCFEQDRLNVSLLTSFLKVILVYM